MGSSLNSLHYLLCTPRLPSMDRILPSLPNIHHALATGTLFPPLSSLTMTWQYPQWQLLYRLPLLFQFWFLQTIASSLLLLARSLENQLVSFLTEIESKQISASIIPSLAEEY
jgi:hypothetical protein